MLAPRARAERRAVSGECGAVTAEIAVALPSIVLVLAACLGGVGATTALLAANDAAADAARVIARGEGAGTAGAHVRQVLPGASLRVDSRDGLVCVTVADSPRVLGLPLPVSARSCALAGEAG